MALGDRMALNREASVKRLVVSAAVIVCTVLSGGAPASASTTSWRVEPVPKAGNAPFFQSVSCPAKGNCTAVGFYHKNGVGYTLAGHWNGTSWALQPTPNPGGDSAASLWGVSCASPASCIAVGYYSPDAGSEQLLAEHWDGSRWALQSVPIPAGAPESELYSVSCTSPASCTAIGQYYPASGGLLPELLAEHWDGTRWTIQRPPLPAQASGGVLNGVSCHTASDCVAVGNYSVINQNTGLLAEDWNGSRWTVEVLPHPAGSSFLLTSVSCPQPGQCTAVGGASNGTQSASIVERSTGNEWNLQQDAAPVRTTLFGVSCPPARSCTAVGGNVSTTGMASRTAVAEHWDGTRWALQPTPVPRPTTTGANLYGVSCLESMYCTAVGVYAPGGHTLAEHEG